MCDEAPAPSVEVEEIKPRRRFMKYLTGIVMAIITLPSAIAKAKKVALGIDKVKKLSKVGGSTRLKIKGKEVLLVRYGDDKVQALNPECTHKKCKVAFKEKTGQLHCKCHKSGYELTTGKVLDGPAPRPLEVYPTDFKDGRIIITLPDA